MIVCKKGFLMITELEIQNFKSIENEIYKFNSYDLLIGANNCGKTTILQAIYLWHSCIIFLSNQSLNSRKNGISMTRDKFEVLPITEFAILWRFKSVQANNNSRIPIEIKLKWFYEHNLCELKIIITYLNEGSISIKPDNWDAFNKYKESKLFPKVVIITPSLGIVEKEEQKSEGAIRMTASKGAPGAVIRNIILKIYKDFKDKKNNNWIELNNKIRDWFNVQLIAPKYNELTDQFINIEYKKIADTNKKPLEIITAGSGFQQIIIMLGFYYGYEAQIVLLDEPDAHLHIELQKRICEFFKNNPFNAQFIIATHSSEIINQVNDQQIISLLSGKPVRITGNKNDLVTAMSLIPQNVIFNIKNNPFVIYVEGADDERIIRGFANILEKQALTNKLTFIHLGGQDKNAMINLAKNHFNALRKIIPECKNYIIMDLDTGKLFPNNPKVFEWSRTNIENYLLVKDAWIASAAFLGNTLFNEEFLQTATAIITKFFSEQRLLLEENQTYRTINIKIFSSLNGKKILYTDEDSLYNQLNKIKPNAFDNTIFSRESILKNMKSEHIHQDVLDLFDKIQKIF